MNYFSRKFHAKLFHQYHTSFLLFNPYKILNQILTSFIFQIQQERENLESRLAATEAALEEESRQKRNLEAERDALSKERLALRGRLEAASGGWEAERVALNAEMERLRHETVAAEAALSSERAAALLQRMRLQYHAPSPHHSAADDDYDLKQKV
jgi:capsule polysaccharide export protein KpsE/RkpR